MIAVKQFFVGCQRRIFYSEVSDPTDKFYRIVHNLPFTWSSLYVC